MQSLKSFQSQFYFAIQFLSSVLCSEGAPEISQPHCGWTRARKFSRPERTPENTRRFPSCLPAQNYFFRTHQPLRSWLISIRRFATWRLCAFALKNPCLSVSIRG
jgi:hypothetical protein